MTSSCKSFADVLNLLKCDKCKECPKFPTDTDAISEHFYKVKR